jgi:hypothetical protein
MTQPAARSDLPSNPPLIDHSEILVDVYGTNAPAGAKFGRGFSEERGASEAQNARREIHSYDRRKT